ncbi:MAG: hypothetical protein KDA58_07015 [Planctomycetaceae bacterium]|nr:hypothetical protein [Planctomycetaceae bacterium]
MLTQLKNSMLIAGLVCLISATATNAQDAEGVVRLGTGGAAEGVARVAAVPAQDLVIRGQSPDGCLSGNCCLPDACCPSSGCCPSGSCCPHGGCGPDCRRGNCPHCNCGQGGQCPHCRNGGYGGYGGYGRSGSGSSHGCRSGYAGYGGGSCRGGLFGGGGCGLFGGSGHRCFLSHGPLCDYFRMQASMHRARNMGTSMALHMAVEEECAEKAQWAKCKFGYFLPAGCDGKGVPPLGAYSMVYPVDPSYFDQRDGQVYAAQGYGGPVAVPLAPNVQHTYNYGWGLPSSRLTPISHPIQ